MKKTMLVSIVSLVLVSSVFSQVKTNVTVRAGKHISPAGEITRIVFETEDESFIKNSTVKISGTQLVIEFSKPFGITPQKNFQFETSIKDRMLTVDLAKPFEAKVMRLNAPPRLVVDILPSQPKTAADQKPVVTDIIPKTDMAAAQRVIVIDPGHGGYDAGLISNVTKEKDAALAIAKDIESLLVKRGKAVFLTRRSDQYVSIRDRALSANQRVPEIFISIHFSKSDNFVLYSPKISYFIRELTLSEAYSLGLRQKQFLKKSKMLADAMTKAIKEEYGSIGVAQRDMPLPILNSVGGPAILIEIPVSRFANLDQKVRAKIAETIIKGFSYYVQ
ncbi:MAG: N-acetylmuramoyl-L-alanine amidase [Nitrospiraceae bacterium]|nr:N-acetylmuramoyl-L-alanine amidase [Nitrospiraceae bacterium]